MTVSTRHHPACAARRDSSAICVCYAASPLGPIYITGHARHRAAGMDVSMNDVLSAVTDPEVRYEQSQRGPGCWIYQRGRIAVAIRRTATEIVALSVLPRVSEVYSR